MNINEIAKQSKSCIFVQMLADNNSFIVLLHRRDVKKELISMSANDMTSELKYQNMTSET